MTKHVVIIQGHPDGEHRHFDHALAAAYAEGALDGGHQVRSIDVGKLDVPFLRSKDEWEQATPTEALGEAQRAIDWADHVVIVYPLWLGSMPARLKAFLEQILRPGFAFTKGRLGWWRRRLKGRSARIVVTMGMPATLYRWYFRAHGLKTLERNILGFCGIGPVASSVIGMVESPRSGGRERWLARMRTLGFHAR